MNEPYKIEFSEKETKNILDFLNSPEYKNKPILCLPRSEPVVETAWGDPYMNMILVAVFMFPWFGSDEDKENFNPFSGLEEKERKNLNESFLDFCKRLPESGMSIDMIPIQLRKAFGMEEQNG